MKNNVDCYAKAIFSFAKNNAKIQKKFFEDIEIINQINSNSVFCQFFSRNFASDFKKKIISQIAKKFDFHPKFLYWLWTIIDNNDWSNFVQIFNQCKKLFNQLNNLIEIEVTSAFKLSKKQKKQIADFFSKNLNQKNKLIFNFDSNLICGLKINYLNKIYDNSIIYQLNQLKNEFLNKNG